MSGVEDVAPQHENRCRACGYVFFYPKPEDENSHPKLCDECLEKGETE